MGLDLYQAGEVMASVKGPAGSLIASTTELGLAEAPISWAPTLHGLDVIVNAFGQGAAEIQQMGLEATITIPLVDFDINILKEIMRLSTGGAPSYGQNPRAGQRFGNNAALYASNNYFWSIGLSSPVANDPITFYACKLEGTPFNMPLGAERSVVGINVRAISYAPSRASLAGVVCWNNTPLS